MLSTYLANVIRDYKSCGESVNEARLTLTLAQEEMRKCEHDLKAAIIKDGKLDLLKVDANQVVKTFNKSNKFNL